ncbi:hypothetical protein Hanom_Chr16g01513341 [Helianthus anomalus]
MGPKDKVQDEAPPKDAYVANVLYTKLCGRTFVCTVIPDGALVMARMSLLWYDIKMYPSFRRDDEGEWSLFDFVDPLRHATLRSADCALNEQEPDVLKIHLEQFLLPAVPADPTAYITVPPPAKGVVPALTAFEAIQAAYVMPTGPAAGVQIKNVSSTPLASVGTIPSAACKPSLSDLISQASDAAAVSCPMPPPMPTNSVAVTTSPVSTPLLSSTPTVFATHEPTSTQDAAIIDAGGSSSGIADDGARLGDDLYLPTINWDPNMQYKRYQPKWKIAESSRLIFPPVIQHRVERAYPPAELAYVEGLNNENLMNSTIVDSVSQPGGL